MPKLTEKQKRFCDYYIENSNGYEAYKRAGYKGKGSVLNGIQFLQQFKIYVHPRCKNTIIELNNYMRYKEKY